MIVVILRQIRDAALLPDEIEMDTAAPLAPGKQEADADGGKAKSGKQHGRAKV